MVFLTALQYPLKGDLTDINICLTDAWSSIVRDIAKRVGTRAEPVPLTIDWNIVRKKFVSGMHSTARERYLRWFGPTRHRELEKMDRA
jgi:hypothetical protein